LRARIVRAMMYSAHATMSLPQGQPHQDQPYDPARTRARQTDAGIARGPGIFVAALTAVIVFVIGQQLFPVKPKQALSPPPAPAPVAETPPAPKPVVDAGAVATAPPAAEAGSVVEKSADAGAAVAEKSADKTDETAEPKKPEKADKTEATEKPAGEEATGGEDGKPIDKQRQADKDLARESWRRNRPDVSVNGTKTSIMVPIRGSIKGAEFKIMDKRRKVVVTLPKAVSMVTMRVYSLKHPLFKKVWIDQDEANAKPADGSKLRFILSQTMDPQVEITEDFVRVTIRRPESSDDARSDKHSERNEKAEKHSDRNEKHGASSDENAASEKD
jgi:hypothetical protein